MGLTWYKPSVISTEESRESETYGTLTTPDEVKGVELAENGLILVLYQATWEATKKEGGLAEIFLGTNALVAAAKGEVKPRDTASRARTSAVEEKWGPLHSVPVGLRTWEDTFVSYTGDLTTGQAVGAVPNSTGIGYGGPCYIFAAAGTYDVSVRFRQAGGGKVTAKNRHLWVGTLS